MARGPLPLVFAATPLNQVAWPRSWGHRLLHLSQPQPLEFNHAATRWGRPSPVGLFSGSQTSLGVDDLAGNVWEWCCSALNEPARMRGWRSPADRQAANLPANIGDETSQRALRGGAYRSTAGGCRAALRSFSRPWTQDGGVGLRLIRTWEASRRA